MVPPHLSFLLPHYGLLSQSFRCHVCISQAESTTVHKQASMYVSNQGYVCIQPGLSND